VTHDQVEAMTMGDRVAVLKDGLLQQVGSPREMYDRPTNVFVAGFIGSPAMNIAKVRMVPEGACFGKVTVPLSRSAQSAVSSTGANEVTLGFRPEDLEVAQDGAGIPVVVNVVEELGSDAFLYGTVEGDAGDLHDVVARVDPRKPPMKGDIVTCASVRARSTCSTSRRASASAPDTHSRPGATTTRPGPTPGPGRSFATTSEPRGLRITAVPDDPTAARPSLRRPAGAVAAESLVPQPPAASRGTSWAVRSGSPAGSYAGQGGRPAPRRTRVLAAARTWSVSTCPRSRAVGVVSGRETASGAALDPALITRHLQFSLPYRALFSRPCGPTPRVVCSTRSPCCWSDSTCRLLLGDCSLSNTLFRPRRGRLSRPISSTPRPASCTPRCPTGSASTTSPRRHEHRRRAARPRGRRAAAPVDRPDRTAST
jgi:hypothetical protein